MSEARRSSQTRMWLGALFLVLGLPGHVFAAQAIGGSAIAYEHHVFGFFVGLVVFGLAVYIQLTGPSLSHSVSQLYFARGRTRSGYILRNLQETLGGLQKSGTAKRR